MNIFYLHEDPITCAHQHADKHVVKMILEYAQLMSTAHHLIDPESPNTSYLYKPTHKNHPSSKWVRESRENYMWLSRLWVELMNEYTRRYGKTHATSRLIPFLLFPPHGISEKSFTPPPPAMDHSFVISSDSLANYRNYYINGKTKLLKYTNRDVPDWIKEVMPIDKINTQK